MIKTLYAIALADESSFFSLNGGWTEVVNEIRTWECKGDALKRYSEISNKLPRGSKVMQISVFDVVDKDVTDITTLSEEVCIALTETQYANDIEYSQIVDVNRFKIGLRMAKGMSSKHLDILEATIKDIVSKKGYTSSVLLDMYEKETDVLICADIFNVRK